MEILEKIGVLGVIIVCSVMIAKNLVKMIFRDFIKENEELKIKVKELEENNEAQIKTMLDKLENITEQLNTIVLEFTKNSTSNNGRIDVLEREMIETKKRLNNIEKKI